MEDLYWEGLRLCVFVREEKRKEKSSRKGSKAARKGRGEELRVGLSMSGV